MPGESLFWLLTVKIKQKARACFLSGRQVFAKEESVQIAPDPKDVEGFEAFMDRYKEGLEIERAAVVHLH
mgnify:CR=1 FL=1